MKIRCSCGVEITVENNIEKVTRYENKPVLKYKSYKGNIIKKEIFYFYICPKCEKEVVEIHRYSLNGIGNYKKVEKETFTGRKALAYLEQSKKVRKAQKKELPNYKHFGKGIPLVYFKSLDDTHQRARYLNDAAFCGNKIESKLIVHI